MSDELSFDIIEEKPLEMDMKDTAIPKPTYEASYTDLSEKPSINGVTLVGDKSSKDLGIIDEETVDNHIELYVNEHRSELRGEKGDQGEKGDKGDKGDQGIQGLRGPQGEQGEKGDKGDVGPVGPAGSNGVDGSDGADGKSAYDIAVDNGFVGTESEWLESLKGTDGANGTDGKDGTNGADGYTPVKGTDYWTSDDISEIQSYIDQQIGGALNGTY